MHDIIIAIAECFGPRSNGATNTAAPGFARATHVPGIAWCHFLMFDFSDFFGGDSTRPVESLGLTEEQTGIILQDQYGLSKALMDAYPDVTKRGNGPNSTMKALIVFEDSGRDCYYTDIANALDVSEDTAYQTMSKVRKWVKAAFAMNVEHAGERIFLVTNQTMAQKAERLDVHIQKAAKAIEALQSDVNSIKQSGQTPVLGGTAGALLAGYEQAKQLEASNS